MEQQLALAQCEMSGDYERGERRVNVVDDKDPKPIGLPEPLLPFGVVGRGIPRVTQRR